MEISKSHFSFLPPKKRKGKTYSSPPPNPYYPHLPPCSKWSKRDCFTVWKTAPCQGVPSLRSRTFYFILVCLPAVPSRGERILFFWPNTNTNNIRHQNFDRIRIRIIFVFSEWANTNTNNIRAKIFGRIRIRIIFGFRIVPEYEYE